jgi:pSer/pThr/pTyr-binding forkhead associated (FHA) protein
MPPNPVAALIVLNDSCRVLGASVETSVRQTIALQDTNILGRSQDSDVTIRLPEFGVGRRQARIWHDNGVWFLEEMSHAYPVRINGKLVRVAEALARVVLNDRDLIALGSHRFWFRLGAGG